MPLVFDESATPKNCSACGFESSFPQYDEREPENTYVEIQIVKTSKGKVKKELGRGFARIWTCKKCGHVDLYTWEQRDIPK